MLQNKKYLGYYVRNNVEIPNYQKPIITEELFNKVQQKLTEKRCNPHAQYYQRGLFTGHVYCGYCGQTFRNNANKKYKNGKVIGKTEFMLCGNKKMANGKCTEQTNVVKKDYLINKCNSFINKYPQKIDAIGMKFGRLTILKEVDRTKSGRRRFLCKCEELRSYRGAK